MAAAAFVDHCLELLAPLGGTLRARRMFGGHGLYVDDLFFALVADDVLYLKVDTQSRPRFEAAGCTPFIYDARTGGVAMSYWSAPDDAMESPHAMLPWARTAVDAALRARALKQTSTPSKVRRKAAPAAATSAAPSRATPKAVPARKTARKKPPR